MNRSPCVLRGLGDSVVKRFPVRLLRAAPASGAGHHRSNRDAKQEERC